MSARHPWWLPLAAAVGAGFLRALGATWRYTVEDAPEYTAAIARGERFVYAFWHCELLPGAVLHRDEGIAVLVSRHRDGEIITRIIERLGYVAARGSSTRGGEAGVRGMLTWASQGLQVAVTPDGPRGPAEQVKPGVLYLAERTGRRLVPIAFAPRPSYRLRSWDRFHVPWPFARVYVSHGAPFQPAGSPSAEPAGIRGAGGSPSAEAAGIKGAGVGAEGTGPPGEASLDDARAEAARARFECAMQALTRDVRVRAGEKP